MQDFRFIVVKAGDVVTAISNIDSILQSQFKALPCHVGDFFCMPEMNASKFQQQATFGVVVVCMVIGDEENVNWPTGAAVDLVSGMKAVGK